MNSKKVLSKKLFRIFVTFSWNSIAWDRFRLGTSENLDELSGISYFFFDFAPTSTSHNFVPTEPIFKILDAMESHGSESFISAILVPQNEFGIPPDARQLTGF